jgi:hypothetical protein
MSHWQDHLHQLTPDKISILFSGSNPGTPYLKSWITKNFDGPRIPLPEGECVSFKSRFHGKHVDQETHLLCVSVNYEHFCCTSTDINSFDETKTRGRGHRGRTGTDLDLGTTLEDQFRLKALQNRSKMHVFSDRQIFIKMRDLHGAHLGYTGLRGGPEHLKIETRLFIMKEWSEI